MMCGVRNINDGVSFVRTRKTLMDPFVRLRQGLTLADVFKMVRMLLFIAGGIWFLSQGDYELDEESFLASLENSTANATAQAIRKVVAPRPLDEPLLDEFAH
jgi:hypothetical protein